MKDQRSTFVFRFQVNGSVFLQGAVINDESKFYLLFLKGVFRHSRRRVHENFSVGKPPDQ